MDKRISFVFVALLIGLGAWSFLAPGKATPEGEPAPAAATSSAGGEPRAPVTAGGAGAAPADGRAPQAGAGQAPQAGPDGQDGEPVAWEQAKMSFGEPGEPGSLEVVFDNLGGTVESARMMDVYTEPGLTPEQKLDPAFWYPIITPMEPPARAIYSYRLEDLNRRFGDLRIEAAFWRMQRHDAPPRGVTFTLDAGNGLSLEKEFRHTAGARHLDLTIRLWRAPGSRVSEQDVHLRLLGPYALPNPPKDQVFGNPSRVIGHTHNRSTGESTARYEAPNLSPNTPDYPDVVVTSAPTYIRFVASVNRFFAGIVAPAAPEDEARLAMAELLKVPLRGEGPNHEKPFSTAVPVLSFYLPVPRDGDGPSVSPISFRLYLGPKDNRVFEARPEYEDFVAIRDIDLEPACCSIPGAKPLGKLLLWIMNLFHGVVNSWGLSIIMLTILVRGALVPLNFKQQKALRAYQERMSKLKPKMDAIKEKYKKNQQRMNQELIAFNKEHKLFPPLMGCLPMLVTLPVFIGLFTALRIAYELRHEDFLFFIKDLSEPDRLIPLPPISIPLMGVVSGINVLPFVMVGLWLFLQRGMPLATDPQQRQMQKMMKWMPIMMGVMFFNYASALMVYMICSSLFGIVEQKITKARLGSLAPGAMPTL